MSIHHIIIFLYMTYVLGLYPFLGKDKHVVATWHHTDVTPHD